MKKETFNEAKILQKEIKYYKEVLDSIEDSTVGTNDLDHIQFKVESQHSAFRDFSFFLNRKDYDNFIVIIKENVESKLKESIEKFHKL